MNLKRKMSSHLKKVLIIFSLNMLLIIATFSVATFAWFSMNTTVGVGGASFTVKTPDSVSYNLYYLDSFTDESSAQKAGDYRTFGETPKFIGYETSYEDATFTKVTFDSDGTVLDDPDPTSIVHLWPAHKLTYAIVITAGSPSAFTLTSWSEVFRADSKILKNDEDKNVSLSWAIDMFGKAYSVTATNTGNEANDEKADVESAFAGYLADLTDDDNPLVDTFVYDENSTEQTETTVVDSIPSSATGKRLILFFTIEFSNDNSTFYTYDESIGYYSKSPSGNSNCYENLQLTNLVYSLA